MKILFCGDVVGRSGRETVTEYVPILRKKLNLDFVVVNSDNAAKGFGVTRKICEDFINAGVDAITGGDHIWDQREVYSFIADYPKLLRPHNFPDTVPGKGHGVFQTSSGKRILVLHLLGQVFIKYYLDSPFLVAEKILSEYQIGKNVDAIIVDFHAEATSEKTAMGKFLDGKVSLVIGSHTHVPTADAHILNSGTAYMTDAGMCGDYDSVIGFEKTIPLQNFTNKVMTARMEPANGEGTLSGAVVTLNPNGLAEKIEALKIGGKLGIAIDEIAC